MTDPYDYWTRTPMGDVPDQPHPLDADGLARLFHETYERLAPHYDYETRKASAVPWEQVPENNRALMVAVAREVLVATVEAQATQLADARAVIRRYAERWRPYQRRPNDRWDWIKAGSPSEPMSPGEVAAIAAAQTPEGGRR